MPVLLQITLGTVLLLLCALVHIAITARVTIYVKAKANKDVRITARDFFALTAALFAIFLVSHTLHIYFWAMAIWALGALPGYEPSIYFSLVTYTTVGYGDVTLAPDFRIFGAMASVTGILMFGFTTAYLVSFFDRMLSRHRP